jgi:hypothetical protein
MYCTVLPAARLLSLFLSICLHLHATRSIGPRLTFRLQEKHPSALAQFEPLLAAAKGKQIVMFLDYDGTLSPIVEDPDRAVMSEEVSEQPSPPGPFSHFFPMQKIPFFLFCSILVKNKLTDDKYSEL